MTAFNWSDGHAFWVNLTNLALGLITLGAVLGAVATAIVDATSASSKVRGKGTKNDGYTRAFGVGPRM